MSAKVIVTGGAGFLGRNLVAELNRRGETDILIVDALGEGEKWKNLVGLQYDDYIDKVDLRNAVYEDAIEDVEVVLHMGACSSTTEEDADYLADNNYAYTRELCVWCRNRGIRFVYASSAATYGDGSHGYIDDDGAAPALEPLNMYGYSKHMFDLWALKNDLFSSIVGLKYFNVYGPHEDHKGDMRSMIHKAYGQIKDTGSVRLFRSHRPDYADGEQKRDFVFVGDAVDQTLWYLDHPEIGGLFNCGTGTARSWNDLAAATFSAMGLETRIEYIDMPDILRDKYQYFTEADMTKTRDAGYTRPPTSLEDGIRQYVTSHLAGR